MFTLKWQSLLTEERRKSHNDTVWQRLLRKEVGGGIDGSTKHLTLTQGSAVCFLLSHHNVVLSTGTSDQKMLIYVVLEGMDELRILLFNLEDLMGLSCIRLWLHRQCLLVGSSQCWFWSFRGICFCNICHIVVACLPYFLFQLHFSSTCSIFRHLSRLPVLFTCF